jgi:hypothetical protein
VRAVREEGTAGSSSEMPRPPARRRKRKTEQPQECGTALQATGTTSQIWDIEVQLAAEEGNIARGLAMGFAAEVAIGQALINIRDKELYRWDNDTFDDYIISIDSDKGLEERGWRLSRSSVYRYMDTAKTAKALDENLHNEALLPRDQSVVGTALRNQHQTLQLKGRMASVVRRIKGGATPEEAVRAELTQRKQEQQQKATQKAQGQQEQPDAEPMDNGFMVMPDGSGKVKMRTPQWHRELGPGVVVAEEHVRDADGYIREDLADPEVTDLATQLVILVERLRDLPRSKAQSVLKPLEAGLLELLDVLGYEFDQEEVT